MCVPQTDLWNVKEASPQKTKAIWFHLLEVPRVVKRGRQKKVGWWHWGRRHCGFNGHTVAI